MSTTVETRFQVSGMTCGHCVASVTEELTSAVPDAQVQVDLATGDVVLTSDQRVAADVVEAAVQEAGYHLVPDTWR